MLCLSRKRLQSILIGHGADQIEITVLRIRGDVVRLGIAAPDDVKILRRELLEREEE